MMKTWNVMLLTVATTLTAAAPPADAKIRIAVTSFIDRSAQDPSIGPQDRAAGRKAVQSHEPVDLGARVADAIIVELLQLNRFEVVERSALDRVVTEGRLNMTESSDAKKAARIVGADLLVTGSVIASSKETGIGIKWLNAKRVEGLVVLNARVVSTRTASASWAGRAEGKESIKTGELRSEHSYSESAGIDHLYTRAGLEAASRLVERLSLVIHEGAGISIDAGVKDGRVVLVAGVDAGVQIGDRFELMQLCELEIADRKRLVPSSLGQVTIAEAGYDYAFAAADEIALSAPKGCKKKGLQARLVDRLVAESERGRSEEIGQVTGARRLVVASDRGAWLRRGPGTSYPKLEGLSRHARIERLSVRGEWLEVRTESGLEGWIHSGTTVEI